MQITSFDFSLKPGKDVLVLWEKDNTKNVVAAENLTYSGDLQVGTAVTMAWKDGEWLGHVIDLESDSKSESDSDSDDIPLATLSNKSIQNSKCVVFLILFIMHFS